MPESILIEMIKNQNITAIHHCVKASFLVTCNQGSITFPQSLMPTVELTSSHEDTNKKFDDVGLKLTDEIPSSGGDPRINSFVA